MVEFENSQKEEWKVGKIKIIHDERKCSNAANKESGASNWLTVLPLKVQGYDLNKEQFWDALRIKHNWALARTPSDCAWGVKFSVFHALSCKKADFVSLRHNELVDIIGKLCEEVCRDVRKQPMLMELNGVKLHQTTTKRRPSKVLEKMIFIQLSDHLTAHNILCSNQWSFRTGRSTESILLKMTEQWNKVLECGKIIAVLFIDFKKAFDVVPHSILLKKLQANKS